MSLPRRILRALCALLPLLCLAPFAPAARAADDLAEGFPIELERVIAGVPGIVYAVVPPGQQRFFLLNRFGLVLLVESAGGSPSLYMDLSDRVEARPEYGEAGLLSMALAPDWETSGTFYLYYTFDTDGNVETPGDVSVRVSRFQAIGAPATTTAGDPSSEQPLFSLAKPTPEHNGGTIAIRDGWLYVAVGDGGGVGDPLDAAQDPVQPLGKMLRFDLSQETPTAEPWALGFRNPFRFSFDRATGDLYVGDVGLESFEEIDVEPASESGGRNYGWDVKEGPECFADDDEIRPEPDPNEPACDDPILIDPVYWYAHDDPEAFCFSVTGGAVYRGAALPGLAGRYFFSDFCSGWVRSFRWDGAGGTVGPALEHPVVTDAGTLNAAAAVVEDGAGELLFVDYDGEVFRLVPEPGASLAAAAAFGALAALRRRRSARRD